MKAMPTHALGVALALAGVIVISPDALLLRSLTVDQWTVVFWRGVLPALAMTAVLAVRHRGGTAAQFRAIGRSGLLICALFIGSNILFVSAIMMTTVANVFVIASAQPLLAAIFSRVFLGEPVRARTWLATGAVLAGVAVIFSGSLEAGGLLGDIFALGTAMCMAGKYVVVRHARAVNMVPAIALSCLLTAIIVLPFAAPLSLSSQDVAIVLILGFVVLPVPFFLFTQAPRYLPAPEVSLILLLESVAGPFLVWLVLDEVPAAETFLGGALILGTLTLYLVATLREARAVRMAAGMAVR